MDLVTDLPKSNGFTAIIVFVDKLTKMVHLAGCKNEVTAMEYAQIFIANSVFRLHGLPKGHYIWPGSTLHQASFGDHCLTCSVWISVSILCFIRRPMFQSEWMI